MSRLRSALVGLALLSVAGAASLGGLIEWGETAATRPASVTVIVAKHSGAFAVAGELERARLVSPAWAFAILATVTRGWGGLRSGEYDIGPTASPAEILDQLRAGRVVVHRLVVPEGLTSAEIVGLIAGAPALDGTIARIPDEGSLWPATYFYRWGETRAGIVERLKAEARTELDGLWRARAPNLPYRDLEEALVLASLVEKETSLPAERPRIAGLFLNRLRLGMKLQCDPTVVYALTGGRGTLGRTLTRSDLDIASPYNTYVVAGLPPGPIANPGRAAIEAALHPEATDALYFVADGTGGHAFSATLAGHADNVARWRQIEAGRAGR